MNILSIDMSGCFFPRFANELLHQRCRAILKQTVIDQLAKPSIP
jgi:hypothetical protein